MTSAMAKHASYLAASSAIALLAAFGGIGARALDYKPVTDERLSNPEPENWLQYRGDNQGWGYSPLKQITPSNVKRLIPAWTVSTGVTDGHQAPPMVNNGVMFVTTPQAQLLAIDAKTGNVLWNTSANLLAELFQLHPTNRGVGLYGDKVYMTSTDACVTALDAATGKVAWDHCVADWKQGYYITLSPMVQKGKVVVGVSGGEFGIRGFISALDAGRARSFGRPIRSRARTILRERPGKATAGRPAAAPYGSRAATIPRPTSPITGPATAARGRRTSAPATTFIRPRRSRRSPTRARSRGFISTTTTTPGTGTRCPRRS